MEVQQIIDDIAPPKKSRHRKKLLYSSIKEQMEFYFSDVNISKDRFISQQLQKDEYVELSIFLQFNKIRRLTEQLSDLCKAISKSEILELSEDNLKVRRKTPILIKENEDECTIYVERLPADTEHDWLKGIFSKFGPVDYVSIPRYKHNRKIKGFAFIEFNTPEIAKKALEYFESIGSKLPTTMLPDKLASISSFETEKSEKNQNYINKFAAEKTSEIENAEVKPSNKRKELDVSQETNEPKKIKSKTKDADMESTEHKSNDLTTKETTKKEKNKNKDEYSEQNEVAENANETTETKKKKKKIQKAESEQQDQEPAENENSETNETTETKKKKKKKQKPESEQLDQEAAENENTENAQENEERELELEDLDTETGEKRKRRRKKTKNNANELQQYGLQVLSKKEWKQLRNKYLNLQRQKMQGLKEHLHRNNSANVDENAAEKKQKEGKSAEKSAPRFEFTPGAIVCITFHDAFGNVNKFKSDIRSQPGLQYVDVKNGNNLGYIRFSDNASAKKFSELENINGTMAILEGNEEKEYWNTILQTRDEKFKKDSKKQRGRDKLIRKAEKDLGKHIRFDGE